jgi:hypothetical protein
MVWATFWVFFSQHYRAALLQDNAQMYFTLFFGSVVVYDRVTRLGDCSPLQIFLPLG